MNLTHAYVKHIKILPKRTGDTLYPSTKSLNNTINNREPITAIYNVREEIRDKADEKQGGGVRKEEK